MPPPDPTPISRLPAAGDLDGTELFVCVQDGVTKRTLLPPPTPPSGSLSGVQADAAEATVSDSTLTDILFGGTTFDTNGYFDSAAPTDLVVPFAGVYRVELYVEFSLAGGSTGGVYLQINTPTEEFADTRTVADVVGLPLVGATAVKTVLLQADDTLTFGVAQFTGADQNFFATATVVFLGAPSAPPVDTFDLVTSAGDLIVTNGGDTLLARG